MRYFKKIIILFCLSFYSLCLFAGKVQEPIYLLPADRVIYSMSDAFAAAQKQTDVAVIFHRKSNGGIKTYSIP